MVVKIYSPEDCLEEMLLELKNGKERGTTTYIPQFDNAWTWRKGEANIWTGYANEGKSLLIKQLCIIKSLEENWKFTFNSPEDYPPKEFYDDIVHTISGKTTDNTMTDFNTLISEKEYKHCIDLIKDNFNFLYIKPPDNTIENCLKEFQKKHDSTPQNGFILDPLMKFQRSKEAPERDDLYATYVDTLLTDFSRNNNVSVHLVIHQLTPKKDENTGLYPEPSGYSIKNGGSFIDGIDNVLFVQRPFYAKDKFDSTVKTGSLKIKKQKLNGIPQSIEIKFNRKRNRYTDLNDADLYDFNKWLK